MQSGDCGFLPRSSLKPSWNLDIKRDGLNRSSPQFYAIPTRLLFNLTGKPPDIDRRKEKKAKLNFNYTIKPHSCRTWP